MAIPAVPNNLVVQQANAQVLITCDQVASATTYPIQRSLDNVTFSALAAPSVPSYLDTTVSPNTQYWYRIAADNGTDTGSYTESQSTVPVQAGQVSLGQLRLMAQQRADRVNSTFVTKSEWNSYINQSAFELYDLITTLFEDNYVAQPILFQTTGSQDQYDLPNGANAFLTEAGAPITPRPFYKLLGVDLGLALNSNAWVSLHKFNFISRNRYVFPNITANYLGVFNLRYHLLGDKIAFIPTPSGAQYIRLWYIPRMIELLADTDVLDGVSGWSEYVVIDAAIKALQKEESDVTVLMLQKQAILDRIQSSAMNRDAGAPDTISNTRSNSEAWGGSWSGDDGPVGGI